MKKLSLSLTFLAVLVFSIMATPQTPFVEAQDFSVTISPSSQTHHPGAYVSYYMEVRSISGFSSAVTLSLISIYPAFGGYNATIEPGFVTPPSGQSAHAVLTIGIPVGATYVSTYTITVRGTGAGLTHDAIAILSVQDTNPDFCVRTTSAKWVMTNPSGTAYYSLNFTQIGAFLETVTAYVNIPVGYTTATFTGGTPTYTVSSWPATPMLTITTAAQVQPGSYPIEIYSSGTTRSHRDYVILVIRASGDFSISASPTSLSINQGESDTSTITVTSTNPFASPTSLSWAWVGTAPSAGVTPSLSPTTVTPTSGGYKTSTLTIGTTSAATKGTFTLMVTGTCYHLSHNVNITLTITSAADFSMTASPTSLSIVAGQTGTSTITITSTGGFSSAVSLSFSWVGTSPTGVTPSLSTYSVTPSAGGSVTSTLAIATSSTTAPGSYVVRITGVSGVLTHSVDVTFTVTAATPPPTPDFTISVSPSSATIRGGQAGSFGITVVSTGGFASPVSLTLSGQPAGVTGTFTPASVTPSSGGSATSTLAVNVGTTTTTGSYILTITGTSGSLSRQASITLTVQGLVCIIATATYGSELSPEVQFLRGFRDGTVMSTFAGSEFMKVFNAWYYSFSPYIAQFIASNAFARAVMKVLLYPLIGILHLAAMTYNAFSFSHELAVVITGLVASALIGIVYFSPLAILALALLRKYRKTTLKMSQLRMLAIVWVASLLMILVGEVALLPALMMASAALFVLSTLSLGALTLATALLRRIR